MPAGPRQTGRLQVCQFFTCFFVIFIFFIVLSPKFSPLPTDYFRKEVKVDDVIQKRGSLHTSITPGIEKRLHDEENSSQRIVWIKGEYHCVRVIVIGLLNYRQTLSLENDTSFIIPQIHEICTFQVISKMYYLCSLWNTIRILL